MEKEGYKTCTKCGIVRNLELAPNCPMCFKKKYNNLKTEEWYEEIKRLNDTKDNLAEEIRQGRKVIKELNKNEIMRILVELKKYVKQAEKIINKYS